ncbi:MAG: hypothetical protein ACTSQZ_07485 [Candidatus Thorarchaeota archaeon]
MKTYHINYEKLTQNLKRTYSLLAKRIASNDIHFPSLFMSKEGKKFGKQIDDAVAFSIRCLIFTLEYRDFIEKGIELFQNKDFRDAIPDEQKPEFDVISESVSGLSKLVQTEKKPDDELVLFSEDDRGRFLAYLTLSVYSYLDAYVDALIKTLLQHPVLVERIFLTLASSSDTKFDVKEMKYFKADSLGFARKWIESNTEANPLTLLKIIQRGLSIDRLVTEITQDYNLECYEMLLSKFKDFRNNIAHGKPAPDIEEFDIDFIKEQWKKMEETIQDQRAVIEVPDFIEEYSEFIWEKILELFPSFNKAFHLPLMAAVYPAIVDQAVTRVLRTYDRKPI